MRGGVRNLGPVAAALLADDEQQADTGLALAPEGIRGRDLRGENTLGVTGSAPVEPIALDAAGKKRRHTIEVRRVDDPAGCRRSPGC